MSGTYTQALETLVSAMFPALEKVTVLDFPSAYRLKNKQDQIEF